MKIRALEPVNTINPEKHWNEGEVMDVENEVALSLIASGKFELAESEIKEESIKSKRSAKSKKVTINE